MAEASKADQVRAGMELLEWTYEPHEWVRQLDCRETALENPSSLAGLIAKKVAGVLRDTGLKMPPRQVGPGWRQVLAARECHWTHVLITSTGLLLESDSRERPGFAVPQRRHDPLVGVYPWRDAQRPLTLVRLESDGWDVLCLRFGSMTLDGLPPVMPVPIPERLKADVEEVAEILWRKTLTPGVDESDPPRWPRG